MREGARIRTAVDVFIVNNKNQVLLGLRSSKVGEDMWGFPGGHQKTGETIYQTAKRELSEEMGGDIVVDLTSRIVAVRDNRLPPAYIPHVTVIMLAFYQSGDPHLPENEKNKEWRWFDIDGDLPANMFSKADEVIKNYRNGETVVVTDFHERSEEAI